MAATPRCSTCGSENDADSRFCRACGSDLSPNPPAPDGARKVVTVLFSDVVGSTNLGETLDPESLRRVMTRYFDQMKAVVHRHGGVTEKFIGDAVMAVFGVPRAHEDDALRAVRAAAEMRDVLVGLNDDLHREFGVRIVTRTGVNTGEVITGDPRGGSTFVTGDAVNVAARLEQSAGPGQILIGETTFRLVSGQALAEPIVPLVVRGKAEPVAARVLLRVAPTAEAWEDRLDSPLVGRDEAVRHLQDALKESVAAQECQVVTVLGAAGMGKSRLSWEFLSSLGSGITVLRGRCLPYGEGITFWPLVGVLREAAGIRELEPAEGARSKLGALVGPGEDAPVVGERLAALLGLSGITPGIQETFWAVRRLFEGLAARGPLVVVFDDIHWGESTFLDLIEYLSDWLQGVPVMLLCLARPELLDVRDRWLTGKPSASTLVLQPLTEAEMDRLIQNLLGGRPPAKEIRARLAEVAGGNPLFVEETLRMLVDEGRIRHEDEGWTVAGSLSNLTIPPTLQALLAARIDMLDEQERAVIERAAVIGRGFWWGAVADLSPPERRPGVGGSLQSLVRKELIRPDRSSFSEEDAFRFTHILVRDAAYRGIPKATRAALHERFAGWLERKSRDRAGEFEEIVGYHLEQAYRARSELGPMNERTMDSGRRAAATLASAGRRAFARGDMPAAVNLLSRAAALAPREDQGRVEILPELAFALLQTGDFAGVQGVLADLKEGATAFGDPGLEANALILEQWIGLFTQPEGWADQAYREATRAISMFEERQDERGLAKGWSLLALFHMMKGQFAVATDAWEQAASHAASGGDRREELEDLTWVPVVVWCGPEPVDEAIQRCEHVLKRAEGDRKAMSVALGTMGTLEAMRGRFDLASELSARAKATLREVAAPGWSGALTQMYGWTEILAGDPSAAEADLRGGVETLRALGELSWLSTTAAILAEALSAQNRLEEAEASVRESEETAGSEDTYSQVLLRTVRARIRMREGHPEEAERLAREAVAIAESSDFLFIQAVALTALGEALVMAGRDQEAGPVLAKAEEVCERKGFSVGAERARALSGSAVQPT